jgi:hypothetical protein
MNRSISTPVQIPGAPTEALGHEADGETKFTTAKARKTTETDKDAEIAALKAQLADAKRLPQVVFEPKTPHGVAALAASDTANMTVAQVMQAIAEGSMRKPMTHYLCADGYYSRQEIPEHLR